MWSEYPGHALALASQIPLQISVAPVTTAQGTLTHRACDLALCAVDHPQLEPVMVKPIWSAPWNVINCQSPLAKYFVLAKLAMQYIFSRGSEWYKRIEKGRFLILDHGKRYGVYHNVEERSNFGEQVTTVPKPSILQASCIASTILTRCVMH